MLPLPPLKLTNGAWISSLKSPYPILEIWADYIMQNLSIPPPEFHLWTHAYAATNIVLPDHQNFLLFITGPDSKFMYLQSPGFVFSSLHFHHKFLAIEFFINNTKFQPHNLFNSVKNITSTTMGSSHAHLWIFQSLIFTYATILNFHPL